MVSTRKYEKGGLKGKKNYCVQTFLLLMLNN
jgi:hypothetical protein